MSSKIFQLEKVVFYEQVHQSNKIPKSSSFQAFIGRPLIRGVGNIEKLFPAPENHHGANHQHLILSNIQVEHTEGFPKGLEVSNEIFVAIRFGDNEGLVDPVPFMEEN
ncbi:hypothetical protein N0Y54_33385 [Nostoc punctiforme UO1]|uniref:hypothetical protein n=1 Tax=Nostoc punctiforme TaxID=272131 RepID=UPI0030B5BA20